MNKNNEFIQQDSNIQLPSQSQLENNIQVNSTIQVDNRNITVNTVNNNENQNSQPEQQIRDSEFNTLDESVCDTLVSYILNR